MGIWIDERIKVIPSKRKDFIKVVLSAYESVLSSLAYASMPITSGIHLYEALDKYGVTSIQELDKKNLDILFGEVVSVNVEGGVTFAKKVAERTNLPVVAPAIFEARKQRWSQDEYMHMWLSLIERKTQEIHMIKDWQYSSGSSEEFTRGIEMQFNFCDRRDIFIFDHEGKELDIGRGILLITGAIEDLDSRGYNPTVLFTLLDKLASVAGFFMDPFTSRREWLEGMRLFMSRQEWWESDKKEIAYPFNWRAIEQSLKKAKAIIKKYK